MNYKEAEKQLEVMNIAQEIITNNADITMEEAIEKAERIMSNKQAAKEQLREVRKSLKDVRTVELLKEAREALREAQQEYWDFIGSTRGMFSRRKNPKYDRLAASISMHLIMLGLDEEK